MSFLVGSPESEDQSFITEILALLDVDEWSGQHDQSAARSGDEAPRPNKAKRGRDHRQVAVLQERKQRAVAYRPRLRNKGKIEELRRQIEGLETQLADLRRQERAADSTSRWKRNMTPMWKVIATKQSQERERAELRNVSLKKMLKSQYSLTGSLSLVLNEWTDLPVPDLTINL
ncbi:hypothetical protein BBJ28_00008038 [Nothophytophthora sp. Chile5]|nr:hypothetical protein BBJ28_00008038 [Nothophytophthora sp. Chile5]